MIHSKNIPSNYRIFPLAAGSKVPMRGGSGFKDALPFPDAVAKWPGLTNGNMGLHPGPSGLLVVDVDVKNGALGEEALSGLQRQYGPLPETYTVTTPSGGWHLYFKRPFSEIIGNVDIGSGIDIRCDKGYVVMAGSQIDLAFYQVAKNLPVAELPQAWHKLFKPSGASAIVVDMPHFPSAKPARVQEALQNIPANLPYEDWIRVLAGLHSEELLDIARVWSSGDPRYSLKEFDGVWDGFTSNKPNSVSIATVFHLEKKYLPQQWEDPIPLPSGLAPVLAYRTDLLPPALRSFVEDIADRMQCPPDFPAVSIVISLATLVGRRCGIFPKREDDWLVVPNLWGAVVGRPSLMKTPAIQQAMKPLDALIKEASKEYGTSMEVFAVDKEIHAAKKDAWKKGIRKAAEKGEPTEAVPPPEALFKPVERRLRTSSGSVECLTSLLSENPYGLLILRDELTGWLRGLDRSGREGDRQFFLEAWNGNGSSFDYDTFAHGHLHSEGLCLSMLGSIQPGPLSHLIAQAVKGGGGDDGMVQRFQLMVYPDNSNQWKNVDRKPDQNAVDRVHDLFKRLDVMLLSNDGEEQVSLRFDASAQEIFNEWWAKLEKGIRDETSTQVESHLAKYRSLMPSIALLLHLAELALAGGEMTPVTAAAASRAVGWCDYLESHARRIYGLTAVAEVEGARSLLGKLKGGDITSPFTARQVYRNHWSGLNSSSEVENACTILMDHGYLKATEQRGVGRPKIEYSLNPGAFDGPSDEAVSKVSEETFDTFDTSVSGTNNVSFM